MGSTKCLLQNDLFFLHSPGAEILLHSQCVILNIYMYVYKSKREFMLWLRGNEPN